MATAKKNTATKNTAAKSAKTKAPAKGKASAKSTKTAATKKAADPGIMEQRDARVITITDKDFTFGGEGTERRKSWDALNKAMTKGKATVGQFKEAGGKVKYLSRWEASKAIKIAA